jgi:electron transfer flavoprotein alpha subunit
MSVLVFVDNSEGSIKKTGFEAVYYGSKTAKLLGSDCIVCTYGEIDNSILAALGNYGASKVILAKNIKTNDNQVLARFVSEVADKNSADTIIFPMGPTGRSVAPRVAIRQNAGMVSGVIAFPDVANGFSVKRNVFSGKAQGNYKINSAKRVLGIMGNAFPIEAGNGLASVEEWNGDAGISKVKVLEVKKAGGSVPLPEAERVVSGGRGMKGPENWGMIEELATLLNAQTACSRPVADMDWRPHHEHVGQTGIAIRPDLYIAIGISGAIQHLAGVNGSKVIVVVNTDPEAPFFKAADYGIVGDAFEVLPKLIEAAKVFNASK